MENASDVWHVPQYPFQKHCITTINGTDARVLRQKNNPAHGSELLNFPNSGRPKLVDCV